MMRVECRLGIPGTLRRSREVNGRVCYESTRSWNPRKVDLRQVRLCQHCLYIASDQAPVRRGRLRVRSGLETSTRPSRRRVACSEMCSDWTRWLAWGYLKGALGIC